MLEAEERQLRDGAAGAHRSSFWALRDILHHTKAITALVGFPLGALMAAAFVLGIVEGDWEPETCQWCEWTMGAAGIIGLIAGLRTASRIWSQGRPPNRESALRADRLVAGWFWMAIVVGLIVIPAIAQGRWVEGLLYGAPIGGLMWFALWYSSRKTTDTDAES